jgi:hypothetical protein
MFKIIRMSVVVSLAVASVSFANLASDQITQIGLTNAIDLLHGSQNASSTQNLVVNNEQSGAGVCGGGPLSQTLFASLGQVGNTVGSCSLIGLSQDLSIAGLQSQEVAESCGPKAQVQSLGLGAQQTLAKADGEGNADALHTIVLQGGQGVSNAAGSLSEAQTIMGMQTSSITGQAGATGLVNSLMNVTTAQTQAAQ